MCLHVKKAVMASGKILTLATKAPVCSLASNIKSALKKNIQAKSGTKQKMKERGGT